MYLDNDDTSGFAPFAPTPQTVAASQVAAYLMSLTSVHRDLWVRRLKKGMKPHIKARLDSLAAAYVPPVTTNSVELEVTGAGKLEIPT